MPIPSKIGLNVILTVLLSTSLISADWSMWGYSPARNMASPEKGISIDIVPGQIDEESELVKAETAKGLRWSVKLGSESFGNISTYKGKVVIGTNNEHPRDKRHVGDRGILMCFDEKTGKYLWQLVVPKLGAGKVSDWEYLGICSSPHIEGDRVYIVTNRCEILCLDLNGMANGNDGPYKDEGKFVSAPGKPPIPPGKHDADIIWVFDMREELGIFPHNIASSSVLVVDDLLYATTSNGQDWSHVNIPAPNAPSLVVINKKTGKLVAEEASGISKRIYHCNWSSPAFGQSGKQSQVVFGAGDGFCYGFDAKSFEDDDGYTLLKELWRFDCNPAEYKMKDGKKIKYPSAKGPNEIIATPVVYKNRVYITTGQDPEHGMGVGSLSCIDMNKRGDITKSGLVWQDKVIERSISTVAIHNDLVYAADYTGKLHCLDANTGKRYWSHDTESNIWASPLFVDDKVFLGNEDGLLTIFQAGKTLKVLKKIEFDGPLYASPVAANGTLYITTQTHLYAFGK